MSNDFDIKIFSDSKENSEADISLRDSLETVDIISAKKAQITGKKIAEIYIDNIKEQENTSVGNDELLYQRKLLLSFTATVGIEQYLKSDALSGIAQKSFLDTVKAADEKLYKTSSDTGAFSFYYLAYRRGNDIERRMGQTFAMLCAHDGDPIFEELGEALYCWFISKIRKTALENM